MTLKATLQGQILTSDVSVMNKKVSPPTCQSCKPSNLTVPPPSGESVSSHGFYQCICDLFSFVRLTEEPQAAIARRFIRLLADSDWLDGGEGCLDHCMRLVSGRYENDVRNCHVLTRSVNIAYFVGQFICIIVLCLKFAF